MKRKALSLIALMFIILAQFSVVAQDNTSQKPKASKEVRMQRLATNMKERLKLSDDQYNKVYEVLLSKPEIERGDKDARRQWQADLTEKLTTILTPEQMENYKKMIEEKKEERKEMKGK